ncbi:MAG: tail fiber domain-containing protein [Longimicrobiaceae bacterium]
MSTPLPLQVPGPVPSTLNPEQVQAQGGQGLPLWVSTQNVIIGPSYSDPRPLLGVVGTPPSDSMDTGSHIMFGNETAVSGNPSATLTFAGWTVVHGGMYWTPSSPSEGVLTMAFGGSDSAVGNPTFFTFSMDGTFAMPQLPNLPGAGSTADLVVDSTGTVAVGTSSARFKENVEPLRGDFDRVLELEPRAFTRQADGGRGIGYLAEEVDALGLRDLVGYDPEGLPLTVDYKLLPVYLVELVKGLRRTVDELRGQVGRLQAAAA